MITGINDLKNISKTYHAIGNVILMVKNVTWIRSGITINASVSAKIEKNIMHAKNVIFRIQLPAVVKMENMQKVLLTIYWLRVMCTTKRVPTNLNEKKVACKVKVLYFSLLFFINYHSIADS